MPLRDPKPARRQWNLRLPEDVLEYLQGAAKARGTSMTSVLLEAIALDRRLDERLTLYRDRLRAFAEAEGLNFGSQLPEVIAEAVIAGVTAREKKGRR